jgi:hypothetical protein
MGIFNRTASKAMISEQPKKAAAAGAMPPTNNSGAGMVGSYYSYIEGTQRNVAMSQPTISRARDLHATTISCMNLRMYNEVWNSIDETMQKVFIAPRAWLRKIDPAVPNSFTLAWTVDDLFFYGRAFWYITSRTADGYPASYTRLPAAMVQTLDQTGPVWFAPSKQIYFSGGELSGRKCCAISFTNSRHCLHVRKSHCNGNQIRKCALPKRKLSNPGRRIASATKFRAAFTTRAFRFGGII